MVSLVDLDRLDHQEIPEKKEQTVYRAHLVLQDPEDHLASLVRVIIVLLHGRDQATFIAELKQNLYFPVFFFNFHSMYHNNFFHFSYRLWVKFFLIFRSSQIVKLIIYEKFFIKNIRKKKIFLKQFHAGITKKIEPFYEFSHEFSFFFFAVRTIIASLNKVLIYE